jgi:hypothetical protein
VQVSTAIAIAIARPMIASAFDEKAYEKALSTLLTTKALLVPIESFLSHNQYDQARTNMQYSIKFLGLPKQIEFMMKNVLDVDVDVDIDEVSEAASRIANTANQIDSTIYTIVFIPVDDTGDLPESVFKYRKDALGFLASLNSDLEVMLKASTPDQLAEANKDSKRVLETIPKKFFGL